MSALDKGAGIVDGLAGFVHGLEARQEDVEDAKDNGKHHHDDHEDDEAVQ